MLQIRQTVRLRRVYVCICDLRTAKALALFPMVNQMHRDPTRLDTTPKLPNYVRINIVVAVLVVVVVFFANLLSYYRLIAIKVNIVGLFFYQFRAFLKISLKLHYISCFYLSSL